MRDEGPAAVSGAKEIRRAHFLPWRRHVIERWRRWLKKTRIGRGSVSDHTGDDMESFRFDLLPYVCLCMPACVFHEESLLVFLPRKTLYKR